MTNGPKYWKSCDLAKKTGKISLLSPRESEPARAVCCLPRVNLAASATLITATLDLQLVRLLRQAAGAPGGGPIVPIGPAPTPEPRPHIHPTPYFEPRPHIEPSPHFEPRRVYHPEKIEPQVCPPAAPAEPETPRVAKSPLEPPWKLLPWKYPPPPPAVLKVVLHPTDVPKKGTVFDVFI